MVRRDREICLSLELCKLLPCKLAVEIYGDKIASHVEADIVVPVFLMHKPRHNMLTGMILHPAEAYFPVDSAVVYCSDTERLVYIMQNFSVFLLRIGYAGLPYQAAVARLAAALGEECRAVKCDGIAVLYRFAGGDRGREAFHFAVGIVKSFRHDYLRSAAENGRCFGL